MDRPHPKRQTTSDLSDLSAANVSVFIRNILVKTKQFNSETDVPGLLSVLPLRPPHSRTLEMRTRICFWHRDLLLLGHGLRLLAIGRLAWSSFTARFCLIRELARAAIFPPSQLWEGGWTEVLTEVLRLVTHLLLVLMQGKVLAGGLEPLEDSGDFVSFGLVTSQNKTK